MSSTSNKIYPQLTGKKILVLGHGRHGKDTIGNLLTNIYGMPSCSSSMFAAAHIVRPYLRKLGLHYQSAEDCYADRHHEREAWFDAIAEYNSREPHRLATDLLESYAVYIGMRNPLEFNGCISANLFDLIIWVDATGRVESEPTTSMQIEYNESCMKLIDNSLTVRYAEFQLHNIMDQLIECDQW